MVRHAVRATVQAAQAHCKVSYSCSNAKATGYACFVSRCAYTFMRAAVRLRPSWASTCTPVPGPSFPGGALPRRAPRGETSLRLSTWPSPALSHTREHEDAVGSDVNALPQTQTHANAQETADAVVSEHSRALQVFSHR